jgi:HlyD family secretion protein
MKGIGGRWAWIAGGLLAVGLVVWVLRPAAVPVYVASVTRGPLQVTVDEEGETRIRQRFVVAAPTGGRLERIWLKEGDTVDRGVVLARIHPAPLDRRAAAEARARLDAAEASRREAEARVHGAEASLAQARRSYERASRLEAAGTLSREQLELAALERTTRQEELEAATFAARSADFEAQAARAALMDAVPQPPSDDRLARACGDDEGPCIALRSPVDGRVLRVLQESERVVETGTPLLELGDPAALEIVVDVLSTDAVRVKPGARVLVENWGGEGVLEARVRLVEPSGFTKVSALGVEEQRVNVVADFVEPPRSLGDAYRVEARIVVWESDGVLKVPASAIFRKDGRWHTFVIEAGRARLREITLGHRGAREVEVLSGLAQGERLVAHPSDRIEDGVRVSPIGPA